MLTFYRYNGIEYQSEYLLRQAIWDEERKAVPEAPKSEPERTEFWSSLNVEVIERPDPVPSLDEAKALKYRENDEEAEVARESQAFTVDIDGTTLTFLTDRKTQQDLQTALTFLQAGMQSYQWIDEQGVAFDFTTPAQIIQVSTVFMEKANVYPTWLTFKNMIDDAETVEEVQLIVIDYGVNE